MAKRKVRTARTRRSRSFFKPKRRSSKGLSSVKLIQFDSMIYGALRGYTSDLLQPITNNIPLGNISDEIVMGGVNYLLAKNTSGMIKNIALKGLVIENARLGEAIISGGLGGFLNKKEAGQQLIYDY